MRKRENLVKKPKHFLSKKVNITPTDLDKSNMGEIMIAENIKHKKVAR
jgi:hypothetical protein